MKNWNFLGIAMVIICGMVLLTAGCATVRYEILDDPDVLAETELSEQEIEMKRILLEESGTLEDFSSPDAARFVSLFSDKGHEARVEEGRLIVTRRDESDGFMRVGAPWADYKKITLCLRTQRGMYFSSHTSSGLEEGTDNIEPHLFLSSGRTNLDVYLQDGDEWSPAQEYASESDYVDEWVLVEVTRTEAGLEFRVNGRTLGTADIDGRPFPGLWLHFDGAPNRVEVDYIAVQETEETEKGAAEGRKEGSDADFLVPGTDINEPVWVREDRLMATTGFSSRLVFLDTQGNIQEDYAMPIDGVERINLASLSPSRQIAAFHAEREDGSQDIYLFQPETEELTRVTQSGACHGPSFYTDDLLIYAEVDEESKPEIQTRIYRYRISTGERELIFERASVQDEEGTSYWWPQVNRDNGDILLCTLEEGEGIFSYSILGKDGVLVQDLKPYAAFDQVWGGAWIDGSTVLASGMRNGRQGYYWISLLDGTVNPVMTDLPDEAVTLYGVNLSPDKEWAVSHCWCEQPDWEGNKLVVFPMP